MSGRRPPTYTMEEGQVDQKGFFAELFDISFSDFITTKIIRVLYVISIVAAVLWTLFMVVSVFTSQGVVIGIVALIISPILFILAVICARIYWELIMVVFRIADNTDKIVERGETPQA